LIKFVDTTQPLSVQVHPDDVLARKRHGSFGKTEMWYVMHAEPGAEIITGFKPGIGKDDYLQHLEKNTLHEILNSEKVHGGDLFFIPAGRIHAIGAGIMLCEIQQSSDVTYRLFDWDRPGLDGKPRDLHTEEGLDAIDFKPVESYKTPYQEKINSSVSLLSCPYFTTNLLVFDKKIESDYYFLDSFVVYICLEGSFTLHYPGGKEAVRAGETLLLPAEIKQVAFVPDTASRVLEVYIA
jgi:mannose-6-phosphate isomerase